jgi:hypothetical protein
MRYLHRLGIARAECAGKLERAAEMRKELAALQEKFRVR